MKQLLLGAIAMGNLIIGLFFLRFWRKTQDRFFLFFAVAFTLEGGNRALLGLDYISNESEPMIYLVRLVSFVLILIAIVDKNRVSKSESKN